MAVGDPLIFLFNPQNIVIMGLRVRRVKRAFGFDKTQTEKYVIVPDRATIVSFGDLCEQVALISGINLGMVQATVFSLVRSMRTFIQQGHAVQAEGFGTFIPSFNAKSSLLEKEANVNSIYHVKLRFLPSAELKTAINSMEFVFDAADSTNDTKAASGEDSSESDDGSETPDEI